MLSARGVYTDSYYCPPEYALIQAAKYLGCTPWELLEQSVYWRDWALLSMSAEAQAEKTLANHNWR